MCLSIILYTNDCHVPCLLWPAGPMTVMTGMMDVWEFCDGNLALYYIWLVCYEMASTDDPDKYLNMITKNLGADIDAEDGAANADDGATIDNSAHPKRIRHNPRLLVNSSYPRLFVRACVTLSSRSLTSYDSATGTSRYSYSTVLVVVMFTSTKPTYWY